MSRSRLLLSAGFITLPGLALAQAPVPPHTKPVVEITRGQMMPAPDNKLYDTAESPWSGSLTVPSLLQKQQDMARIPGSVALVPSEVYAAKYAVDFKDMLGTTPGVFAQNRFGEETRLSIRGSGLGRAFHLRGLTILQDGVPINLADGSGDFQEIDPLSTRSIEVYKGANGLPYGAATLGGVINVITPTGYTAPSRNEARIEVGSYGLLRTHASAARVVGHSDAYASVTAMTSDGYRDQSAQQKGRFNGNIGYRFNDDAETRFYITYNNLNQEVPGTLSLRRALDTPKRAPTVNNVNDYARDIRSVRLANKTSFVVGTDKTLDVGAYAAFKDLFHPIFQVIDQESQTYGAFTRLKAHDQLAGHRNDYTVGVNATTGHLDALQYTNVRGSRGTKTADADQDAAEIDVYGENQFYVTPKWSLVTGVQGMIALRDFTNNVSPANNDRETFTALNPKMGTVWDVRKDAQIFANISRSSEAPTFSELVQAPLAGFVPLDMQTAWTGEVGTRGRHGRAGWDVTAYHARLKNELLNFTTSSSIPAAAFNADDTIHQGLELGFDLDVGKSWLLPEGTDDALVLRQVYNLNDFRFDGDAQFGDNRIGGAPLHQYRAELRYAHGDSWSVTPNVEAVPGGGYVDHANTLKAPGYAVVGINGTIKVQDNVDVYVDGRNLLDKRYVSNYSAITNAATANTEVFYPGEGRTVFAGLKVRF